MKASAAEVLKSRAAVVAAINEARKDLEAGRPAQLTLAVRAVDGDFNSQPEHMNQCWNVLGVQVNHWNKVKLNIDPALPAGHMVPPPPPPPPGYPKESKKAATSG